MAPCAPWPLTTAIGYAAIASIRMTVLEIRVLAHTPGFPLLLHLHLHLRAAVGVAP